jgi:hypothetical protein
LASKLLRKGPRLFDQVGAFLCSKVCAQRLWRVIQQISSQNRWMRTPVRYQYRLIANALGVAGIMAYHQHPCACVRT